MGRPAPGIDLASLSDPDRLHPDDWVWITPDERDALVEAVQAAQDYLTADDKDPELANKFLVWLQAQDKFDFSVDSPWNRFQQTRLPGKP